MFEKVNPCHPDKVADRIAGAIVDFCYTLRDNPKVSVEVLIGHGYCTVIVETSEYTLLREGDIMDIIERITGIEMNYYDIKIVPQDSHLAENQNSAIRCGDNGIFKGMPLTGEEQELTEIARFIFDLNRSDGKYIIDKTKNELIICQSNTNSVLADEIYRERFDKDFKTIVTNPLGDWTGGTNVDTGATNRKLGSDMGQSVTGGGLHGKDLSKADVAVNIYAFLKAQETGKPVELSCAIGDTTIDGKPYVEIVEIARNYISRIGGFEKFAEWGLIR